MPLAVLQCPHYTAFKRGRKFRGRCPLQLRRLELMRTSDVPVGKYLQIVAKVASEGLSQIVGNRKERRFQYPTESLLLAYQMA